MEGNSDVSSASTLEAQLIGETGGERSSTTTGTSNVMYKTESNQIKFIYHNHLNK